MIYEVRVKGEVHHVEVTADGPGSWVVVIDGVRRVYSGRRVGRGEWFLAAEHRARALGLCVDGDQVHLQRGGSSLAVQVLDPRRAALDQLGAGSRNEVHTQMPGVVVRVPVSAGDRVEAGQVLVVVEAMKMENEFKAPFSGVVEKVSVAPGKPVEAGALLVLLGEG